jgi:outer membrane protein X
MKKRVLKFATLAVALVMVGFSANAQEKGDKAVGGNVGIAIGDGFTNVGIGAKFQYNLMKKLRGEGAFTYYVGEGYLWDLSVNAHYLIGIPNVSKLNVYPLAGLSIGAFSGDDEPSYDPDDPYDYSVEPGGGIGLGLNLGGGAEYKLTDKIFVSAELKYRICFDTEYFSNKFMVSVGVAYKF